MFIVIVICFLCYKGFNHIIFYDNNSTTSLSELEPWIELGFVTIIRDWWLHDKRSMFTQKKHKYFDMMRIKMMAEVDCKRRAISMGYEIFASVDLDEYIIPSSNDSTVIDEMVNWFHDTTRGVMILSKYQFPPTPHYLGFYIMILCIIHHDIMIYTYITYNTRH